jgi:restriction system protein
LGEQFMASKSDFPSLSNMTQHDGLTASEATETEGPGQTDRRLHQGPGPFAGRPTGRADQQTGWAPPFDLALPAADVSIVPEEVGPPEKRRRREGRDRPEQAERGAIAIEQVTSAYAALEIPWQDRLLECLLKMEPDAFERLCQKILKESGFIKVEVTGRSGDGGIDGIGVLRLNLLSFHVFFQCKRWKGSVGPAAIRDFRGAMVGRADKGLVMTTGTFTVEARKEATRDGAPAIDLIDGEALCDLLKRLKIGVSTREVEHVFVEQQAFLEF